MQEAIAPALTAWESFYVIVGSSGAALTGLQFVVIALVADTQMRSSGSVLDAFATPTIVHFCAVLMVSAVLSAPWHTLTGPSFGLSAMGAAGVVYTALVLRRARRQKGYAPVLEDWIWHVTLPFVAYATLLVAGVLLPRDATDALFAMAAAAVLLLFIGIHNAWDTVTYIVVNRLNPPGAGEPAVAGSSAAGTDSPAA
jgi:hypothetical protein